MAVQACKPFRKYGFPSGKSLGFSFEKHEGFPLQVYLSKSTGQGGPLLLFIVLHPIYNQA
jgi:hypothetical protein